MGLLSAAPARLGSLRSELSRGSGYAQYLGLLDDAAAAQQLYVNAVSGLFAPMVTDAALAVTGGKDGEKTPVIVAVTATPREAERLAAQLKDYLPDPAVQLFPGWETLPHEQLSPSAETVAQRLKVLHRLKHPDVTGARLQVLVAPVRSVTQPLIPGLRDVEPVRLKAGGSYDFDEVVRRLVTSSYARTDMVTRRGEMAVRGGIIDVFPPGGKYPARIDFFGDRIESIRSFSTADQRSVTGGDLHELEAWPCRELLLTDQVRRRAQELGGKLPDSGWASQTLRKLADGIAVDGMESLAPLLTPGAQPLCGLLPERSVFIVLEPLKVAAMAGDLVATNEEFLHAAWSVAADGADVLAQAGSADTAGSLLQETSFIDLAQAYGQALASGRGWWNFSSFAVTGESYGLDGDDPKEAPLRLESEVPHRYRGDMSGMLADIAAKAAQRWIIVVAVSNSGTAERLNQLFRQTASDGTEETGKGGYLQARIVEALPEKLSRGVIYIVPAATEEGFILKEHKAALLTEFELLGTTPLHSLKEPRPLAQKRRRNAVDLLTLQPGDYIVHDTHGIGRFVELTRRASGGAITRGRQDRPMREYLVLEYASRKRGTSHDLLYVPSDQLDQVTRYVGGETPRLSRLGGGDWEKIKGRARKAVKEIARELIRLYSARMTAKGHVFAADTPWQRELEDSFPYVETPDQLTAIKEVKADMEREIPMDRLISGDVGYGKTEIAVRAAFKAVQDGKQVAVLVPTTLLVQQHFETFSERFAGFPVRIRPLSRFQTAKEVKETLSGLEDGGVDVVIGTHRLLSKGVGFKDLGLVIIDEEQRFGVEHKEQLKKLRTNVDVLAMSATPIPRTLEMAVTGIREMSTLATPPEERHPVLTYVGPYTDKQVVAAIRRELMREGQVFYVHNRVFDIDKVVARLKDLVPESRVAVAHGQMPEAQLEQIIVDFWEKRFDVLVCTTIIETGLDIANANTLIVDQAQRYGLSQLHQLRGRVGRGRERAYAYFLYPDQTALGEVVLERLKAVATHNELGAGMQLAMKDLEIRGAGNLLGGEQSGHIQGVGFDLYIRLVGEAVSEYKGESPDSVEGMKVELPVNAYLPHEYIAEERLRLEAYRNIAAAYTEEAVAAAVEELTDRYGQLPEPAAILAEVAALRVLARGVGLSEIAVRGNYIRFGPVDLLQSRVMRMKRIYPGSQIKTIDSQEHGGAIDFMLIPRPKTARVGGSDLINRDIVEWARQVIEALLTE